MSDLTEEAYLQRIHKIREKMTKNDLDGHVFFSNRAVNYLTGYRFIPTERPIALLVTPENIDITAPKLEEDAAESESLIDDVYVYYDYPRHSSKTPEKVIGEMVKARRLDYIGADMNGAPETMGYEGKSLGEITGKAIETHSWIEDMRIKKSKGEVEVLKKSAKYADKAFESLRQYIEPGRNEVSMNLEMKKKTAEIIVEEEGSLNVSGGKLSYYRILSGSNTYNPHGQVENRELKQKDILLPGMALAYQGYHAELERTMFLGEPTDKQKEYYRIMLEAQKIAENTAAADVKLYKVDQEVHDYFREQGVLENTRHHTGHGLGLQGHEKPFIDRGNDKKLKENMVISLEPGIYFEEAGGFRHSDTFVVKESGLERITEDPRDLESNIL